MPVKRKMLEKIKDDVEFYEHQVTGVRLGAKMTSFLLADEMGLGKCLEALTVAAVDFERGYASRMLVVCPSFLKWNWVEDIVEFTNFTWIVLHGDPKQRQQVYQDFNHDILIVGYEQLARDWEYINELKFDILCVDEAHYIKNRTAARTKAVLKVKRTRTFLLTGSPMLNRPNELWTLLHCIDPKRFNKYWPFVNRYCVFGGWKSKQIVGAKNKQELRGILQEYMIRRLKKDCLDLPDKQHIRVYVDLHPEQKKLYDQIEADMKLHIPNNPTPLQAENILTRYLRHKQVCGTPATLGFPDDSTKLDRAVEMIQEFTEGSDDQPATPVVVFTQFRGVADALDKRLAIADIPCWQLNGDTPQQKRILLTQDWANSPVKGVLILMLQMAVGLNLTAANKGIFIDQLYVPKLNEQAEDRMHRIGASLTHPIQIFILIAKGTIEERIEKILRTKAKLFAQLIGDEAAWKRELIAQLASEAAASP
jgi:SNF2 family DNA or RNA helicase